MITGHGSRLYLRNARASGKTWNHGKNIAPGNLFAYFIGNRKSLEHTGERRREVQRRVGSETDAVLANDGKERFNGSIVKRPKRAHVEPDVWRGPLLPGVHRGIRQAEQPDA